jgi:protein glucosyltransferase
VLNVGSNGYANKLKYLFLTGSVVLWVKKDSLNYEFFEHQARPPTDRGDSPMRSL